MTAAQTVAAMAASAALGGAPDALAPAEQRAQWNAALVAFRAAHAQLEQDFDSAEAGERFCEASTTMITTPAPDGAALLFKLEHLWGDDPTAGYCEEWVRAVMADAHRLLWNGGRA